MNTGQGLAIISIWGAVAVVAIFAPYAVPLVAIVALIGTFLVS